MRKYRHKIRTDDHGVSDLISAIVMFYLFMLFIKYYSDKQEFYKLLVLGIFFVLVFIIFFKNYKKIKPIFKKDDLSENNEDRPYYRKSDPTPEAIKLCTELIKNGLYCELEKYDGHKHIDIAITNSKLNIEVDGNQHFKNYDQIVSDSKREYYSAKKGYKTLRYSNFEINDPGRFYDVVNEIIRIAKLRENT